MDEHALRAAGYRRIGSRWGKPLGYSLLVFDPAHSRWSQVYRDQQGTARVWTSVEYGPDSGAFDQWLARVENYHGRLGLPGREPFHFSLAEDVAAEVLDG